jgi:hypothetical protein
MVEGKEKIPGQPMIPIINSEALAVLFGELYKKNIYTVTFIPALTFYVNNV